MKIFCTGCGAEVDARLTDGAEMYPHRADLEALRFWVCDVCRAFVGCDAKGKDPMRPLGFLATPEIKTWRRKIHEMLDPLWKQKRIKRGKAYAYIAHRLGRTYHTAEIYSVEDGMKIFEIVRGLKEELDPGPWNK